MNILNGITPIRYQNSEYTSALLISQYNAAMQTLQTYLTKGTDPTAPGYTPLTPADYTAFANAINTLLSLAQNGASDPNSNFQYMSSQMAQAVNLILTSLQAAGISIPPPANPSNGVALLQSWQSLGSIASDVVNVGLGINTHSLALSLQSMLELEYVKQGNDMIANNLANLEQALQVTQQILNVLQNVQNISNDISAPNPSTFSLTNLGLDGNDIGVAEQNYKNAAAAYFSQLYPSALPTSSTPMQLLQAKSSLLSQIPLLDKITPGQSSNGVIVPAHEVANTLANFVYRVALDISSTFQQVFNGVDPTTLSPDALKAKYLSAATIWILDGQEFKLGITGSGNAGAIQNHITQAINSAESLNDTQKENVQNYLFIFQQFYTSASTVLQKITQIVEKFAQGIAQ